MELSTCAAGQRPVVDALVVWVPSLGIGGDAPGLLALRSVRHNHDMSNESVNMLGNFAEHLGIELTKADGDGVEATWKARPELHQPYGIVHGGVHCTVVETLASIAAALWIGDRGRVVGVNNNTDFYRAVTEGEMHSVATPVHRGRSQQVWDVLTTDSAGRMVARGSVRLQNLYPDR